MSISKRKIFILIFASAAAFLILGTAIISAYFMDGETATNEFTIGGSTVSIVEDFEDKEELFPGDSFIKDVKVRNDGPSDCYVRVLVEFSDGMIEDHCTLNYDQEDWIYNAYDGYWYYKSVLGNGEISESLFTKVTINEDYPETLVPDFDIFVYTESCQYEEEDDYASAWKRFLANTDSGWKIK